MAVVGAGSGIGRGAALLLAARGAFVGCVDVDKAAASATASEIADAGGASVGLQGDVRHFDEIDETFAAVEHERGQLHGVVNCAGVTGAIGIRSHEVDLDDFDATYAVNLRGALVVSQAAIKRMLPKGYGRIVHVASIAGKEGNPNMVAYSATKAGIIGMVKSQGKEYAQDGITVNAVAPAVVGTPFIESQPAEVLEYMTNRIPMGRVGSIAEVAEMLAWIVSPECSFTTGFTFDLSGGRATY
jgi:2-dehydro-3-deoxy-L-rhamnonate dehydrogenase (NAD+)